MKYCIGNQREGYGEAPFLARWYTTVTSSGSSPNTERASEKRLGGYEESWDKLEYSREIYSEAHAEQTFKLAICG
jgi:hypothetical protein